MQSKTRRKRRNSLSDITTPESQEVEGAKKFEDMSEYKSVSSFHLIIVNDNKPLTITSSSRFLQEEAERSNRRNDECSEQCIYLRRQA